MIKSIEKTERFATTCRSCGLTLINPGYNKTSVLCCGKYRRWYNTWDISYQFDDGRDEQGRFHHKPHIVDGTYTREIYMEGGV